MESPRPLPLPIVPVPADHAVENLLAAIELVALRAARRVVICGVAGVEAVSAEALAHAQARGVAFRLERDAAGAPARVVIGPLEG